MPVLIMGGLALASGVMGAFGQSGQAKAQAIQQQMQQDQANFQNQMKVDAENRAILRQRLNQEMTNLSIAKSAGKQMGLQQFYAREALNNARSQLSKNTQEVNAQFMSALSSRGISAKSGTARALLRQNIEATEANSLALRLNGQRQMKDIETNFQNALAQRRNDYIESQAFIPTTGGIVDASSSALTTGLIQAGLGGLSAGVGAGFQYAGKGTIGFGTGSWF
jgi:hypothetical protein